MPSVITTQQIEGCLRDVLTKEGYKLSQPRGFGETGVDIKAEMENETLFIEVIGYKSSPPARAKDFFQSFFRAISRLKEGAKRVVIAQPARAGHGLPARARQYGQAWERLGKAFPELEIWLIDIESQTYKRTSWNDWLSAI
jgi:hypothetical protein